MPPQTIRRRRTRLLIGAGVLSLVGLIAPMTTAAAGPSFPSDKAKPDLASALSGYHALWQPSGDDDLHGTVLDSATLQYNDQMTSWINQHATRPQRFRALQNSSYLANGKGYDQSISIADGLGKHLGDFYATGRIDGSLPLTGKLLNTSNGSVGAYLNTSTVKSVFGYPRPFLPGDPKAAPMPADASDCAPGVINSSSLVANRQGKPWADSAGDLTITRVPATVDKTREFADTNVRLNAGYGRVGLCTGGSYPSGHTASVYRAGITLATLLPELAPQILARASEAGNNRIVLGVHYPLDTIGGRMSGEIAASARWSDAGFRTAVLMPARKELVSYLTAQCTAKLGISTLSECIAADTPYANNPYGGAKVPGGTAQIVSDRRSALEVYTERLSYGFRPTLTTEWGPSVPEGAENLLRTAYPSLTAAQRRQILAQTEIASGYPLDTSAAHAIYPMAPGSWQRLNLAAAMSAGVKITDGGAVEVLSTGGKATVVH